MSFIFSIPLYSSSLIYTVICFTSEIKNLFVFLISGLLITFKKLIVKDYKPDLLLMFKKATDTE